MTQLSTTRMLDVPPKLVLEVAYGVEPPEEIAERYGFSSAEWLLLKEHKPFVKQVEDKKEELRAGGYTFRMKSAVIAEELLTTLYLKAKEGDASFHTILETVKLTAKAAGFEAPPKEETNTGSQFSITINLGGGKSVHVGHTPTQPSIIDMEPEDTYDIDLGEIPWHLRSARSELRLEVE